jgi:predicted GTPase
MKTFNTEVLVAFGEVVMSYSIKSPKTGKMLSIEGTSFLPPGMADRMEKAVYATNLQSTGYAKMFLTVADFKAWKDAYDAYVEEMMRVEDFDMDTEPYEVRFGPRGE